MNMDDASLPELTRRQEEILSLIVRSYTQTLEPVSSKFLVEAYQMNVSTATVRNEMAALEELGYITAPHTSSGRVPTESGYRYFVRRLISDGDLSTAEQSRITEKFQSLPSATEQWMRLAATTLARTSQIAALVTSPISETSRFKHLELISVQGRLTLMVLVLHGGAVHQQMLTLAEPVLQTRLSEVATHVNALCADLGANEVRMKGVQLPLIEREITELAADLMDKTNFSMVRLIYRDGLSEVIRTFHNREGAEQAVRVFEERAFLNTVLTEALSTVQNGVRVVIAGEGRWEELSHLSMVLGRYGIPGQSTGALGVLGPTHINYVRAIGAVRYVSTLMTDMMADVLEDEPARSLPSTIADEE